METNQINLSDIVNKKPERDHHKQSIWQIWFPLGAAILIFILTSVWVSLTTASNQDLGLHWANVSAIFLMLPLLLVSLLSLILFGGLAYGLGKLLSILPPLFGKTINFFYNLSAIVRMVTDKVVAPILTIRSQSAKLRKIRYFLPVVMGIKTRNKYLRRLIDYGK